MKIPTFDGDGKPNGYVVPIWSRFEPLFDTVHESFLTPEQVYLTAVTPHSRKGPHLHMKRYGLFCCIKGNVKIVMRHKGNQYTGIYTGEKYDHGLIHVAPGTPACIYNDGDEEALVINMPSPAWSAEDPDEWPVEDWNP